MRILFTGASSFTGSWFVRALAAAGHEVTATFRKQRGEYEGIRRRRVELVAKTCRAVHGVAFGDDAFLEVARDGRWDLLAHHAAETSDYRSSEFDAVAATATNTRNAARVLEQLRAGGTAGVVLTGTVFEGGEGAGSDGLPHLSRYGLSKALTAQVFAHDCARAQLRFGKFVIPNPFGPYEEQRFTAHLVTSWLAGRVPTCATPAYVRDNIHVSLLAAAYVRFAERVPGADGDLRTNPSGYVETQGEFARRVSRELAPRLGVACPVELAEQTEFPEPLVRINTDPVDGAALGWDEATAWDELARYYLGS